MKTFRVYLSMGEQVTVDTSVWIKDVERAEFLEDSTGRIQILAFFKNGEVVAQFMANAVRGWIEQPETMMAPA